MVAGAIAFALAHGRAPLETTILFVDGVGFGVAYVTTGSLRAPIAWHAAKNFAVWLLAGSGTVQFATVPWRVTPVGPSASGAAPSELTAAVVIVAAVAWWLARERAEPNEAAVRAAPSSPLDEPRADRGG